MDNRTSHLGRRDGRARARRCRAFTLVEILIVVVILGILGSIAIGLFGNVRQDAEEATIETQIYRIRSQIEYFRARTLADPDLLGSQWTDMVSNDYLQQDPVNTLNGSTVIAAAPGAGVGWVWRDSGTGSFGLYATDAAGTSEWIE